MTKASAALLFTIAVYIFFAQFTPVSANELGDFKSLVPSDMLELLPEGTFDSEADDAADTVTETLSAKNLLKKSLDALKDALVPAISQLSKLLAIVIIMALFNAMKESFEAKPVFQAFDFAAMLCVSLCCFEFIQTAISAASSYLSTLTAFMTALAPFSAAMLISTGNAASAAVTSSGMLIFVDFLQYFITSLLMPALVASTVLTLCDTGCGISSSGLSTLIRRVFTFGLSFASSILIFTLSSQTTLAESADSFTSRTLRFIIGGSVPVVGGALSDALRTVNASLQLIRRVSGSAGIAMIILALLPVFFTLVSSAAVFSLSSAVADVFGCAREKAVFSEMSGICSLLIAVCAMSALLFIFALTLFVKVTPAYN